MSDETVAIEVPGKTYRLPKKIKVGQFLGLDLQMVIKLQESGVNLESPDELTKFMEWMVAFLKRLGIDTIDDDMDQLLGLMMDERFPGWLTGLFGNLLQSKS